MCMQIAQFIIIFILIYVNKLLFYSQWIEPFHRFPRKIILLKIRVYVREWVSSESITKDFNALNEKFDVL